MPLTLARATKKFQRTYSIQIQGQSGDIHQIGSENGDKPVLTLEFNVKRDILSSANSGSFRIRNLNSSVRSDVYHDWYDLGHWRSLIVKAGYSGTPLSSIFNGLAQEVSSYREEGGVDFVTDIGATDWSLIMPNSFSSWTIGSQDSPVTRQQIIDRLVNDLQINTRRYNLELGIGVVGDYAGNRYTYTANDYTWNLLQVETQRTNYIDNGKVYCLPNDATFEGDVSLISSATGLLGTPRRHSTYLIVEMLFEPSLTPGQLVYLDTSSFPLVNSFYNGTYKVTAVQHAGVISSTVSGKCKTVATLQIPPGTPFLAPFGL